MRFVKASPSEYLVVSAGGEVTNRGLGASAFLWPRSSPVVVPATKQEACFEMTQESRDGLPLRFKGFVMFHISDPLAAVRVFDFTGYDGIPQIQRVLSHVCLGELRAAVSHLTMSECIEQRKTTLTDAVTKALTEVVKGGSLHGAAGRPWGISLDVVQVAQVYVVDEGLRRQLEAEVRNQIHSSSELARIDAAEKLAGAEEVELKSIESRRKVLAQRRVLLEAEREVRRLEVEIELAREIATQDLRRAMLPLEQAPELARALAGILSGMRVSILTGESASPVAALAPLVEYVAGLVPQPGKPE